MYQSKPDLASSLKLMKQAIHKEEDFQKAGNSGILAYLERTANDLVSFITLMLHQDELYLHYHKKVVLHTMVAELNHLKSTVRYYKNYNQLDRPLLLAIISKIENLGNEFAKYGSLYVFRHCEKTRRIGKSGIEYEGIPLHAIKEQAMKRAKQIIDEIRMSPKKVRIVFLHTEMVRTKLFAEIIAREILNNCADERDKIKIESPQFDPRIKFDFFTKEALNEIADMYKKKGEDYTFLSWFHHRNEFEHLKHQPDPREIIISVDNFVKDFSRFIANEQEYRIVIAISHSFVIDAYLLYKIPEIEQSIGKVIRTADFFKVECGELNYKGKWVGV